MCPCMVVSYFDNTASTAEVIAWMRNGRPRINDKLERKPNVYVPIYFLHNPMKILLPQQKL